jgi:hypothetical protein
MSVIQNMGVVVQCGCRERSNWRRINSALIPFAVATLTMFSLSPLSTASSFSSDAVRMSSRDISSNSSFGISKSVSRTRGGSHMTKGSPIGSRQFIGLQRAWRKRLSHLDAHRNNQCRAAGLDKGANSHTENQG